MDNKKNNQETFDQAWNKFVEELARPLGLYKVINWLMDKINKTDNGFTRFLKK